MAPNVSLGGHSEPVLCPPPPLARNLALAAAASIRGDLGVDLLPTRNGYVISELNGAVDFRPYYTLDDEDVYTRPYVLELLRVARDRRALRRRRLGVRHRSRCLTPRRHSAR